MGAIIPKLRASARGQVCTFQIVGVCNHDPATTVLAHLPSDVKGMGNKSDDYHAVMGCSNCHAAIDTHWLPREEELSYMLRALQRTIKFWVENGYLIIPGVVAKPRPPSNKTIARRPMTVQPTRGD